MSVKRKAAFALMLAIFAGAVFFMATYDRADWSPEKTEVVSRPNLIYPSGRILAYDNFESPVLGWVKPGAGTLALDSSNSFNGSASMKITTPASANAYEGAAKRFGRTPTNKIGIQALYQITQSEMKSFDIVVDSYNGAIFSQKRVRYVSSSGKWQYLNSANSYTDITGGSQSIGFYEGFWHNVKLIVDLNTGEYVGLFSNDVFFDLVGLSGYDSADSTGSRVSVEFEVRTSTTTAVDMSIDNVAITEED